MSEVIRMSKYPVGMARLLGLCAVRNPFTAPSACGEGNGVNGSEHVAAEKEAASDHAVNGADVAGGISNINGKINLTAAHVAGRIHTVSGNSTISSASHVEGGILVKKPSGSLFSSDDPTIIIGRGVTVQGELRFGRQVRLFVTDKATIGTITGATPMSFTGDTSLS